MRSEATLCLFGHVGQDPRSPSQKNPDFIAFSLAVTTSWKDQSGEKQEHTDWYEVVTSQKGLSGLVSSYVKKGEPLYIEGAPKYGVYTSKDGEVKHKVTVNLSKIVLLGQRKDEDAKDQPSPSEPQVRAGSSSMKDSLDDEIPF